MTDVPAWIEVPATELSAETLEAVVDEFISREGTDYGLHEIPLETQRARALAAIQKGEIAIVFDTATESVQLLSREDLEARKELDVLSASDAVNNDD